MPVADVPFDDHPLVIRQAEHMAAQMKVGVI